MSVPAEGTEGMFRNPINTVARFLETAHGAHYKVTRIVTSMDVS